MGSERCGLNPTRAPVTQRLGCFLLVPSRSRCPNFSIPLISPILTAHPNCLNLAVTSPMVLLSPHLLVFPFTDVLTLVLSTAQLIKTPVLRWSSLLLYILLVRSWQILTYCTFWPCSPLHSCVWNSSATSRAQFPPQPHMAHLALYIEADNLEGIQRRDCKRD